MDTSSTDRHLSGRWKRLVIAAPLIVVIATIELMVLGSCSDQCSDATYPDPSSSPYVLPYPVGRTYTLFQSCCNLQGHRGRFAYDFEMLMGDTVTAARPGVVIGVERKYDDFDHTPGHNNRVLIRHEDSTIAFYAHFRQESVLVSIGDTVGYGEPLGLCGMSGRSGGVPHVHLEVFRRVAYQFNDAVPLSFRNLRGEAAPNGRLIRGRRYTALPYEW
jgi:murein DD-endopeptidase MepM/ murein hydrolase activator NlpD